MVSSVTDLWIYEQLRRLRSSDELRTRPFCYGILMDNTYDTSRKESTTNFLTRVNRYPLSTRQVYGLLNIPLAP